MRAVFGVGTLTADAGAFEYRQRSLVDDGISVTRVVSQGSKVLVRGASSPDLVAVAVRAGSLEVLRGNEVAALQTHEMGLIPLGEQVELRWEQVTLDVFSFPQSSLRRILGVLDGSLRLHAPRLTPRSPKVAALWFRLATLLSAQVLEDPELYERDQVREQMIDALLGSNIEAFDLSNAAEEDTAADDAVVRRAEAYMTKHLGEPIAIPDVARAAAISERGLQLTFQRRLGTPPLVRLRELRLAKAREMLTEASHGSTTVGGVGRRVGYSNLGRFSAHYRSAFGESPSTTLRDHARRTAAATASVSAERARAESDERLSASVEDDQADSAESDAERARES